MDDMRTVAVVKFRTAQKHYYFDPVGLEIGCGDKVVVETARGIELGIVRGALIEVSEKNSDGVYARFFARLRRTIYSGNRIISRGARTPCASANKRLRNLTST